MTLYKYIFPGNSRKLIRTLKELLRRPYIWAADPRSFNDVFEFKVLFDWKAPEDAMHRRYFLDNSGASETDFQAWRSGLTRRGARWYIERIIRSQMLGSFGVCSFSLDPTHYLLWAHYAHGHEGACLEYHVPDVGAVMGYMASGPVLYRHRAPRYNHFMEDNSSFMRKTAFYKARDWNYEKEFRLLTNRHGRIDVPREWLAAVYLGCKADLLAVRFAHNMVNRQPVAFYQMIEDHAAFRLHARLVREDQYIKRG